MKEFVNKNLKEIINKNLKDINFSKIFLLIISMFIFSILYTLLDDIHFSGVNKFQETVKDEVIKNKVKQEIIENYSNARNEDIINKTTQEAKRDVKKNDLNPTNVSPTILTKYLNRLYFSINTGCLLGYGDIYPTTLLCKIITSAQGLLTITIIIS
jgi:hypothetical protein